MILNRLNYTFSKLILVFVLLYTSILLNAQDQTIEWVERNGVNWEYTTAILTKTASPGWGNGGAFSLNRLESQHDGYISYVKDDVIDHKSIGLSYFNVDDQYNTIDFSYHFDLKRVHIFEGTNYIGYFGDWQVGETYKVQRIDAEIQFLKDDEILHSVNLIDNNQEMFADVSIYEQGAKIENARASFGTSVFRIKTPQENNVKFTLEGDGINNTRETGISEPFTFFHPFGADQTKSVQMKYLFMVNNNAYPLTLKFDVNGLMQLSNFQIYNPLTNLFQSLSSELFTYSSVFQELTLTNTTDLFNEVLPDVPMGETPMNWVHQYQYDGVGNIIAEEKTYLDLLGREAQTQVRNIAENKVLTSAIIYDAYGRGAIKTLLAPTGNQIAYREQFMIDASGNAYNYTHFDTDATKLNPTAVAPIGTNNLGAYYSNQGEDYVAESSYPYARVSYNKDPLNVTHQSTQVGDQYQMGSGHESSVYVLPSAHELEAVFGTGKSYQVEIDPINRMLSTPVSISGSIKATKTISINQEGETSITYQASGVSIASCRSGIGTTCAPQSTVATILYDGSRSTDIHVPASQKGSVSFPLPTFFDGLSTQQVPAGDINYVITDLVTYNTLVEGTHFIINPDRTVQFLGVYATDQHFFRIAVDLSQSFTSTISTLQNATLPETVNINHSLDYSLWSINYYDFSNQLRKVVSPKAVSCDGSGTHTFATTYDYSEEGQVIAVSHPDQGLVEYLYDSEGKLRFMQNSEQKLQDAFTYMLYDGLGRVVETGVYSTPSGGFFFENYYRVGANTQGTISVHTLLENEDGLNDQFCEEQTFLTYDQLSPAENIPSSWSLSANYAPKHLLHRLAKSSNEESTTWYSYNQRGQLEFQVQHIKDPTFTTAFPNVDDQLKTTDYEYDANNFALVKKIWQKNVAAEFWSHEMTYDSDVDLIGLEAKENTGTVASAKYNYYLHGALKRTELGNQLQGIDYVYTIQGKLKSINHPTLNPLHDPGMDGQVGAVNGGFKQDVFGMTLDYHKNDYQRAGTNIISSSTSADPGNYNGLIQAMRYKITSNYGTQAEKIVSTNETIINQGVEELIMKYTYDDRHQLSTSRFGIYKHASSDANTNITTLRSDYYVFGNASNGGIDYDKNGNILSLNRNGYDQGGDYSMDYLKNTINTTGNQLLITNDQATVSATAYNTDFEAATPQAFGYNSLGQLKNSIAEGIQNITYYALTGRAKKVVFTDGNTAEYFYNDQNKLIRKKYTDNSLSGTPTKTIWYVEDVQYEQDVLVSPTIALTSKTAYGKGRLGVYDIQSSKMTYELKDHLGNVRATVQEVAGNLVVSSWADYYPFGGVMPGRSLITTPYEFSYQGQRTAEEHDWHQFDLRLYSAALGRWTSIDPYNQFHSPYLAMANNPVSQIDPDGGLSSDYSRSRDNLIDISGNLTRESYEFWFGEGNMSEGGSGGGNTFNSIRQRSFQELFISLGNKGALSEKTAKAVYELFVDGGYWNVASKYVEGEGLKKREEAKDKYVKVKVVDRRKAIIDKQGKMVALIPQILVDGEYVDGVRYRMVPMLEGQSYVEFDVVDFDPSKAVFVDFSQDGQHIVADKNEGISGLSLPVSGGLRAIGKLSKQTGKNLKNAKYASRTQNLASQGAQMTKFAKNLGIFGGVVSTAANTYGAYNSYQNGDREGFAVNSAQAVLSAAGTVMLFFPATAPLGAGILMGVFVSDLIYEAYKAN